MTLQTPNIIPQITNVETGDNSERGRGTKRSKVKMNHAAS